jgi:N-methylhydantoinase B
MVSMGFDPITFEVIRNALSSITDEMMLTVQRTGRSPTTTQAFDFSTALCDSNGDLLDQGLAIPIHMGGIPDAVRACMKKFDGRIYQGDAIIVNDPYSGGLHLPDVFCVMPIFVSGDIFGYSVAVVHHMDVGGRAAGSMAHDSTEIYQEGLRIPPLKLYERGQLNPTMADLIQINVRTPEVVMGDFAGQIAACKIGEKGILALVEEYGEEVLKRYLRELMDYSERITRKAIASWPQGTYQFTDYMDDDGITNDPIRINVTLHIKGDSILVDFAGSSPQTRGAINCVLSQSKAMAYAAIRCAIGQDMPNNSGCFRAVQVTAPEGTITNMRHPASCAARGVTSFRILDAVLGALAQAIPEKLAACCEGGTSTGRLGFAQPDGKVKVFYDNVFGTRGAWKGGDGRGGVASVSANISNVSIEILESQIPVRIRSYGLVPNSGGPGRWQGGLAQAREWEVLAEEATITWRSDRRKHPPYGLQGGKPGAGSMSILNPDTENKVLPTKINTRLKKGDVFRHQNPGGGGYGDPMKRDPQAVLWDWRNGKVTAEFARSVYGVVIDEGKGVVDEDGTRKSRLQQAL